MKFSPSLASDICRALWERQIVTDYVKEYGEPGYSLPFDHEDHAAILIGYWWCQDQNCNYRDKEGKRSLHSVEEHYKRIFAELEDEGFAIGHWSDEWLVDNENNKCYRINADHSGWMPQYLWLADKEPIFPDDGIEAYIEAVINNPHAAMNSAHFTSGDLKEQGWREFECGFEIGHHPGQDADPEKITEKIREKYGDTLDILFQISGAGQFDISFCVWVKESEKDGEDDE